MRQLMVDAVDFVKRHCVGRGLKGDVQPQKKAKMRQIIVDMIYYYKKWRIRDSLKGTIPPKVEMHYVVMQLLGWLRDEAASRDLSASEQTFQPLMLELECDLSEYLKEFVLSNPLAMELFRVSDTSVSFQDSVSTEERLQIEQYVLKSRCPEVYF